MGRGLTLLRGGRGNAGLASLSGGVGRGFSQAGKQIASLGGDWEKQDRDEEAILRAEQEANKKRDAAATYNSVINPSLAKNFNNEQLGRITLSAPKEEPKIETKKTIVDDKDVVHVVFSDGSTQSTGIKSKDYWSKKPNSSSKKDKAPEGYVYAGELNIDDDLEYDLAVANAYYTDKDGKRFVNKSKYENLKSLGNEEIR